MTNKSSDIAASAAESLQQFQKAIEDQFAGASNFLDSGISSTSDIVKSTTATIYEESQKATGLAKSWYAISLAGLKQADQALISTLKDGINIALENETAATAAAITAALIILPATRRLLWRQTIGRFQSAESVQQAAEARIASLGQAIEGHTSEIEKISENLSVAQTNYQHALQNLQDAAGKVRSLSLKVDSTERKAKALMQDLRELRSKHALQLRSDMALKTADASKQKATLDKLVHDLAKEGL